jgi:hypothetical protein
MSQVNVTVAIDDAHLSTIQTVAEQLHAAGMAIQQVLPTVGVITGSIDSEQVDRLSQVEGVARVEREQTFQLRPPESDIQ